jgi:ferredoxin-nitrite reductase
MPSENFLPGRTVALSERPQVAQVLATACPGLFYTTPAQDGLLFRIRVPGGCLTATQALAIADIADCQSEGILHITNRANIQIRTSQAVSVGTLTHLQTLDLAARSAATDHLRNIMLSPTAGIDRDSLWDPRPVAQQWSNYLADHPELAVLSAKFSVGFDGGEAVSIGDRPNDIVWVAITEAGELKVQLKLGIGDRGAPPESVGIQITPDQVLPTLAALAAVYRDYTEAVPTPTPRLRALLQDWGRESYLAAVAERLSKPWQHSAIPPLVRAANPYGHIGSHRQRQVSLSYLGVALPLGRLSSAQLRGVVSIAQKYAQGQVRLTPWQNLLIADIPSDDVTAVAERIQRLGLPSQVAHPWSRMVACAGKGCKASVTDTQADALVLADQLVRAMTTVTTATTMTTATPSPETFDHLRSIHVTGCEKSCAQHPPADLTLLGVSLDQGTGYRIYQRDRAAQDGLPPSDQVSHKFGHLVHPGCPLPQISQAIAVLSAPHASAAVPLAMDCCD